MSHREVAILLDSALSVFTDGRTDVALSLAFAGLNLARRAIPDPEWRQVVQQVAAVHPLRDIVHLDPMTRRAFDKPRGYAGDAELLDFMYRLRDEHLEGIDRHGLVVHRFLVDGPAPSAVRHRLQVLAQALERVGQRASGPGRVLALACGHLRELALVPEKSWPRTVVAMDQDADSLAVVEFTYADPRVVARRGTVRDVLARRVGDEPFDLVYAADLFDYLDQPLAAALTARLIELVAPGGRLLVANFTPDTPDIGFMEAMLDWHLVYRAEADMWALLDGLPAHAGARTWRDPGGCIVYLEVERLS